MFAWTSAVSSRSFSWTGATCVVLRVQVVRSESSSEPPRQIVVHACGACGYWESEHLAYLASGQGRQGRSYDSYTLLRRACLREFTIVDDDAPIDAVRRHLERRPADSNYMRPKQLELLVGSVFEDFLDCKAIHVGRTGDGGVDLVLIENQNAPVLIQVKNRQNPRKAEPVSSIREFLGAMVLKRGTRGMFVTTSHHFTRGAERAAKEAEATAVIEQLDLVNASRLLDILRTTGDLVRDPWMSGAPSLSDHVPDFRLLNEPRLFGFE